MDSTELITTAGTALAPRGTDSDDYPMPALEEKVIARARELLTTANALAIVSDDDAEVANEELQMVKSLWLALDTSRKRHKAPHLARAASVDNLFREPLEWLVSAEDEWKTKLQAYRAKQTEIARKAREEAERQRAAELAKAEAEARAAMQAAQAAARAAQAATDQAAREAAEQDLREAAERTAAAEARAIEVAVAPTAAPEGPKKLAGYTEVVKWKGRGVNLRELVHAAAKDDSLLGYLDFNERAIDKSADGLGPRFKVPGCIAEPETTSRSSKRRKS